MMREPLTMPQTRTLRATPRMPVEETMERMRSFLMWREQRGSALMDHCRRRQPPSNSWTVVIWPDMGQMVMQRTVPSKSFPRLRMNSLRLRSQIRHDWSLLPVTMMLHSSEMATDSIVSECPYSIQSSDSVGMRLLRPEERERDFCLDRTGLSRRYILSTQAVPPVTRNRPLAVMAAHSTLSSCSVCTVVWTRGGDSEEMRRFWSQCPHDRKSLASGSMSVREGPSATMLSPIMAREPTGPEMFQAGVAPNASGEGHTQR